MQRYVLLLFLLFSGGVGYAQTAKDQFFKGIEYAKAGELEKAISWFDKAIKSDPDLAIAYYNRGIAYNRLDKKDMALADINRSIALNPQHPKSYLQRAFMEHERKEYEQALADFARYTQLVPTGGEGKYHTARVYADMGQPDSACKYYSAAVQLGYSAAKSEALKCGDTIEVAKPQLLLTRTAENRDYGFKSENPIKVGGTPSTQRQYLEALRDAQGQPITYERLGSCCAYPTPNSPLGMGMLDIYEITYRNHENRKVKENVYITFYDYVEPLVLYGFTAVK